VMMIVEREQIKWNKVYDSAAPTERLGTTLTEGHNHLPEPLPYKYSMSNEARLSPRLLSPKWLFTRHGQPWQDPEQQENIFGNWGSYQTRMQLSKNTRALSYDKPIIQSQCHGSGFSGTGLIKTFSESQPQLAIQLASSSTKLNLRLDNELSACLLQNTML
jgi:hypothetical protein